MTDKILRRDAVEQLTGFFRSTVYSNMKEGSFPQSVRLGKRAIRWLESELHAWLTSRKRGPLLINQHISNGDIRSHRERADSYIWLVVKHSTNWRVTQYKDDLQ
ncbi:MAG: AlpA family phage regulatory protein [Pseudomonadota bacterium]